MSGLYTNGMGNLVIPPVTGAKVPVDTGFPGGENPETAGWDLHRMATAMLFLSNNVDRATVAGSRYYRQFSIDYETQLTGVSFLVGSVGGTDSIIVELHDSAGNLVATSNTAGVLLGTANIWQQIPFYDNTNAVALPYLALPGTYYIAIQSNGTTGKLRAYESPGLALPVGSATGAFGTGAAIVPPTTYTAGLGPVSQLY